MEDTRLTKAADLAARKHVLLTREDVPDAWKLPRLKSVGRQLHHWSKKVGQPFGAPVSGVGGPGSAATPTGDDDFEAGPVQDLVDAIGQDRPRYKTERPLHVRQKTTCTAQTPIHSECQKETAIHPRSEYSRVGQRAPLFG